MLLMMLERGEQIAAIVFFDTGWEFPGMYPHIHKLEKHIERKIWRISSPIPFDFWLTARPIVARKGRNKGQVTRIGNGWPSPLTRWCTRQKVNYLDLFSRPYPNAVQCVGYAADEKERAFTRDNISTRFPLQEWGVTEADALQYCFEQGFDWGGLYDIFPRVSCYCCPLQSLSELRKLRKHFPGLWDRMLYLETQMEPKTNRGFRQYTTVHQLEQRFAHEDMQGDFFCAARGAVNAQLKNQGVRKGKVLDITE